jgi:uncharacterized protein YndB with AHSA1/START domain
VWFVLTTPEMIERWMSDEPLTVISEWRIGAPIVMRGILHGLEFENHGTIQSFEAEKVFQYNYWSTLSISRLADSPENYSSVRFELLPVDAGTLLTITLSDFAEPSMAPHANLYWSGTLEVIKAFATKSKP